MDSRGSTRLAIASGCEKTRRASRILLEGGGNIVAIHESRTFDELFENLAEQPSDVLVVSLSLSGSLFYSGLAAIAELHRLHPGTKMVAYTDHCSQLSVLSAMSIGVLGCLTTAEMASDLAKAVDACIRDRQYVSPGSLQSTAT